MSEYKYTPTTWIGGKTIGTADVMNNIEDGIAKAHERINDIFNVTNSKELTQALLDEYKEIRLTAGYFNIDTTLTISSGQKLILNPKTRLVITGNHDGIVLELGGSIEGGVICLKSGITYGSSMLKVIPYKTNNDVNRGERTNIQDMKIIARDSNLLETSVGIHLCDDLGLGIYPVNVLNCCIVNTYTGIKLSGTSNMAWVNGNSFTNVDLFCNAIGIDMNCGLESTANKFTNIQFQTGSNLKHAVKLVRGDYNCIDIFMWDMVVNPVDLFYIYANSTNNEIKCNLFAPENENKYVNDLSWNNTYYSQPREFIKLADSYHKIDLTNLDSSKMYPVVFNSPIHGFICKTGYPGLSIDLNIVPCGWDLLNPMYTVSISQPVDGKMCSDIYGKYEDTRTAIYLRGGSSYNFYDNLYSKVNLLHKDFSTTPKIYTNSYTDSVTGWSVAPKAIGETITNGMYVGFGNTINITGNSKPVRFATE